MLNSTIQIYITFSLNYKVTWKNFIRHKSWKNPTSLLQKSWKWKTILLGHFNTNETFNRVVFLKILSLWLKFYPCRTSVLFTLFAVKSRWYGKRASWEHEQHYYQVDAVLRDSKSNILLNIWKGNATRIFTKFFKSVYIHCVQWMNTMGNFSLVRTGIETLLIQISHRILYYCWWF